MSKVCSSIGSIGYVLGMSIGSDFYSGVGLF